MAGFDAGADAAVRCEVSSAEPIAETVEGQHVKSGNCSVKSALDAAAVVYARFAMWLLQRHLLALEELDVWAHWAHHR